MHVTNTQVSYRIPEYPLSRRYKTPYTVSVKVRTDISTYAFAQQGESAPNNPVQDTYLSHYK